VIAMSESEILRRLKRIEEDVKYIRRRVDEIYSELP